MDKIFSPTLITPKATHTWTVERGVLAQVQILNILVKRKIVSGGSSAWEDTEVSDEKTAHKEH